jgi:hypothetical protein
MLVLATAHVSWHFLSRPATQLSEAPTIQNIRFFSATQELGYLLMVAGLLCWRTSTGHWYIILLQDIGVPCKYVIGECLR